MSKRISNELNKAVKEYRSCFNCTFFKIKPFKFNELNKQVNIDFLLVSNTGRCVKDMFKDHPGVGLSLNSKTDKSVILRDALKSLGRYKTMAENCDKYDGEIIEQDKKTRTPNKRVKYHLVKYLF